MAGQVIMKSSAGTNRDPALFANNLAREIEFWFRGRKPVHMTSQNQRTDRREPHDWHNDNKEVKL